MAMTREKVLRKLEEGDDLCGKNLSGLDLSGLTFSQSEFNEANLSGANLRGVQASQCEFNQVDFAGANLDGSTFKQCEFEGANIANVSAQGATFWQCEFPGGAKRALAGATFKDCLFDGANDESTAGPAGPASPWKQMFAGFPDWTDPERKTQAVEALFGALAPSLQAVEILRRPNDQKVELRAAYHGYPVRIELQMDGYAVVTVQMKRPDVTYTLAEFFYEPEFVPEPAASAWHQGELVRVFVGKGLFVRGISGVVGGIEQILPLVAKLPHDFMPELVAIMTGDDIHAVMVYNNSVRMDMRLQVHSMYDPCVCLGRAIHLGARTAYAFETVLAAMPAPALGAAAAQLAGRCRYCNAMYIMSAAPRCANCGAPA